jgi:N-acetylglutamate synthase-like GNAT family acetyltransferase
MNDEVGEDPVRRAAVSLRLTAIPLATWERDGVKAALRGANLPTEDVEAAGALFWRFEARDMTPVGFGGLEVHGRDALLRSIMTLPPLRNRGIAGAIVGVLEAEARIAGCQTIWLLTVSAQQLFGQLGYAECSRSDVPQAIRDTHEFTVLCVASATVMTKSLA